MKHLSILLFFCFILTGLNAQIPENYVCELGFEMQISRLPAWGNNKPVVTSVVPSSPAAKAGLKVNDIIEKVSGVPTQTQSLEDVIILLYNEPTIRITINNLQEKEKTLTFEKECKPADCILEKDMVSAFSFYSLENAQDRSFSCPFTTTISQHADLISYRTFGFTKEQPGNERLEETIRNTIREVLTEKGLVYQESDPDLLVSTYYAFVENKENYTGSENQEKLPTEWRYNVWKKEFEKLPIFFNPLINEKYIRYRLKFGIQLIDRKQSTGNELVTLWECEANESLNDTYDMASYARIHIPLMFMQYPYAQTFQVAKYRYRKKKYNYTGIMYDMDNLRNVKEVVVHSPAYDAEIQAGDQIEKINDIKMNADSKKISLGYKKFIGATMDFRDEKTKYTDTHGFAECMLWQVFDYPKIGEEIKRPVYFSGFSYLFYFEPYINLSEVNQVTFDIKRENEKLQVRVKPVIRTEESFELY